MRKPYRTPGEEVICTSAELMIPIRVLNKDEAKEIAAKFISVFNPINTRNHCQIGATNSVFEIPSEGNEYTFSTMLNKKDETCILLFDISRNIEAIEVRKLFNVSNIIKNSFGMEFFVTDSSLSFGMAINYYAIEAVGNIDFEAEIGE